MRKVRFFCSLLAGFYLIVNELKKIVNQNGACKILSKKLDVFWCVTQRVGFLPVFMNRKDIQYAHYSGAQIHEVPQSRFRFFRLS